ncbi:hypothetical protein [Riemerella anatipestifer]|nr:hypothetical protein [Riemerella anatipestifer]MCD5969613.1 hypothetical protein [Riemerella anatipestifer]
MITITYHHSLVEKYCIKKYWFTLFGKRLFVLRERIATREEALRSLNYF